MIQVAYSCDVCGTPKKECNHWFISEECKVGIDFHTWDWAVREGQLENDGPNILRHLCSQGCCVQVLDGFLSKQKARWQQPVAVTGETSYTEDARG
jgi:hypothetical protein